MIEFKLWQIGEHLQENLEDYTLKTDEELINQICEFGCGEDEFHTADVERLIKEKEVLLKEVYELRNNKH